MPGLHLVIVFIASLLAVDLAWGDSVDHQQGALDPQVTLQVNQTTVTEGFVTLSWKPLKKELAAFELVVATDPQFHHISKIIQTGSQTALHLSGFSNGDYFVKLRLPNGNPVSNTTHFRVQHRDLQSALGLFMLGLIIFITLAVLLFKFTRSSE